MLPKHGKFWLQNLFPLLMQVGGPRQRIARRLLGFRAGPSAARYAAGRLLLFRAGFRQCHRVANPDPMGQSRHGGALTRSTLRVQGYVSVHYWLQSRLTEPLLPWQ